jgi:cellulose synthase (UDP-forming)
VWGNLRGLGLRQRLQFLEILLFYLSSFTVLVYIPTVALALLGWAPLKSDSAGYLTRVLPLVLATEMWLLALNRPYNDRRKRERRPYRALWQVRTIWIGLAPIYIKASLQAIVSGPNRKPVYKVTRKQHDQRWHWRHTLPQATIVLATVAIAVYAARFGRFPDPILLLGTVYWGGLNVILLSSFVSRGWHGVGWAGDTIHYPVTRVAATTASDSYL